MRTVLKLTCLFAFVCTFSLVSAQNLSFGVRAGVNLANVNIEQDGLNIEPDSRTGLNIGAILNIGVTDAFSVQPELSFIQKGYSLELLGDEVELILNYLEIPILAKYAFGSESFQGFVQAGPAIGFALNGKSKFGDEEEDIDFDEDGLNTFDFGLQFGAGAAVPAGPGEAFLDLRYALGLANISDDESGDDITTTNRGLLITVGYLFPIGGK